MGEDLERLKRRIPLLQYLQHHHWSGRPAGAQSEFVGLCPLHEDTRPSFYVNPPARICSTVTAVGREAT